MSEWVPNIQTRTQVADLVEDLFTVLPDVLGIDEFISGCEVIELPPSPPDYATLRIREYHLPVYWRGTPALSVGEECLVVHLREGNRYEIIGPLVLGGADRSFLAPATGGYDIDAPGIPALEHRQYGLVLVDGDECRAFGHFVVPDDFDSDMIVVAVIRTENDGNIYARNVAEYGQCSESRTTHGVYDPGPATFRAVAVTTGLNNCIMQLDLTTASIGDIVDLQFIRDAGDALDTINDTAYIAGWIVSYRSG